MFSGTLSIQNLLSSASPEEIWNEIMRVRNLFCDGGIILGPCNIMQVDLPVENFDTMIRAIQAPISTKFRNIYK